MRKQFAKACAYFETDTNCDVHVLEQRCADMQSRMRRKYWQFKAYDYLEKGTVYGGAATIACAFIWMAKNKIPIPTIMYVFLGLYAAGVGFLLLRRAALHSDYKRGDREYRRFIEEIKGHVDAAITKGTPHEVNGVPPAPS